MKSSLLGGEGKERGGGVGTKQGYLNQKNGETLVQNNCTE